MRGNARLPRSALQALDQARVRGRESRRNTERNPREHGQPGGEGEHNRIKMNVDALEGTQRRRLHEQA